MKAKKLKAGADVEVLVDRPGRIEKGQCCRVANTDIPMSHPTAKYVLVKCVLESDIVHGYFLPTELKVL